MLLAAAEASARAMPRIRMGSPGLPGHLGALPGPTSANPGGGDTRAIATTTKHSYGPHRDQIAELTLPAGRGAALPVAVLIHGGFWRARYNRRLEDALVVDLADRGWAVWNLEYRRLGWRSRGGWPATFEDVAEGIDRLGTLEARLELASVFAIGHSAGGQLAFWAAARRGLPPRAPGAEPRVRLAGAVAQAGLVDLREALRLRLSGDVVRHLLDGPPGKYPQRYDLASPIERLPLRVPRLLVHGEADGVVPISIAYGYHRRALEAGDPCELVALSGVGHMEHLDPGSAAWPPVVRWLEYQRSR